MNDSAERLGTPEAGSGSAHDLDTLYQGGLKMLKRSSTQGCRPDPDAIHQDQHVMALGAAHADPGRFAIAAADRHVYTGDTTQQLGQGFRLQSLNILPINHGNGGRQPAGFYRRARPGNDDFFLLGQPG